MYVQEVRMYDTFYLILFKWVNTSWTDIMYPHIIIQVHGKSYLCIKQNMLIDYLVLKEWRWMFWPTDGQREAFNVRYSLYGNKQNIMILILDGNSKNGAQVRSNPNYLTCFRKNGDITWKLIFRIFHCCCGQYIKRTGFYKHLMVNSLNIK